MLDKIIEVMDTIEYGYKDSFGNNILDDDFNKWEREFNKFYYLQSPCELLETKCGVCYDQVELERKLFNDHNILCNTYFVYLINKDKLPSHTFLIYQENNKYYWFENSWIKYKGIHEYNDELSLLLDVIYKFKKEYYGLEKDVDIYLYRYQKPKFHISIDEFYKYIETQELIEIEGSNNERN